ncbi:hypothetical protein SAMN05660835_00919 [Desulfurella multipotens]|uniref:SIMPL domain-containing protein n=2 Tax=Desulfurella TaxID=33001 RepID=A0A1G6M774_9BACT|nr:SIMPL domain-containing protein [Desulfurella multipotens]SDC51418.1 hypothetical protein SAMN05660835_00919 [Desulfurella multipotens]
MKKLFVLLIFFFVLATNANANENATLSVSGHGIITAIPDIASIDISIISQSPDPAKAMFVLSKKANDVVKALFKLGIKKDNLSTTNLTLEPVYQYDDKTKTNNLAGYKAKETFNIKSSIDKMGFLISKVSELGIDEINRIYFESSNISNLKLKAIEKAMEDALLKAQSALINTGYQIIGIKNISITEKTPAPIYFDKFMLNKSSVPSVPIEAGRLNIEASVSVIYILEKK